MADQRRGSIISRISAIETSSGPKSRKNSVISMSRRGSVLDDDSKLREVESKLKSATDMLTIAEQNNARLKQDLDDLMIKFNEVRSCAIDTSWRYCPLTSPDFVHIPVIDSKLQEGEHKVGKYVLKELLGKGQFSVVRACTIQGTLDQNGNLAKPESSLLAASILPTNVQDEKESTHNGSDLQRKKPITRSACKIISKENIFSIFTMLRLEQEIKALKLLQNHKNIVEFRECLHGNQYLYIITEYVSIDLFEFLETNIEKFNDNIAGVIMRELVEGVSFIASKGIVHRDLKPENILISLSRNDVKVKICDFGLCSFIENGNSVLSDFRGSPGFFAPEVLLQQSFCSLKAEIFSIGCIALELLVPQRVFAEIWMAPYIANLKFKDVIAFNRSIRDAVIESNNYIKTNFSESIYDFIHQTLNIVPSNRKLADELRNFDWITHANKFHAADILNSREPRNIYRVGSTISNNSNSFAENNDQSNINGNCAKSSNSNVKRFVAADSSASTSSRTIPSKAPTSPSSDRPSTSVAQAQPSSQSQLQLKSPNGRLSNSIVSSPSEALASSTSNAKSINDKDETSAPLPFNSAKPISTFIDNNINSNGISSLGTQAPFALNPALIQHSETSVLLNSPNSKPQTRGGNEKTRSNLLPSKTNPHSLLLSSLTDVISIERERDLKMISSFRSKPINFSSANLLLNSQINTSNRNDAAAYAYNPGLYCFNSNHSKEIAFDYNNSKYNITALMNNLDKSCGYRTVTVQNLQDNQRLLMQNSSFTSSDLVNLSSVHLTRQNSNLLPV